MLSVSGAEAPFLIFLVQPCAGRRGRSRDDGVCRQYRWHSRFRWQNRQAPRPWQVHHHTNRCALPERINPR